MLKKKKKTDPVPILISPPFHLHPSKSLHISVIFSPIHCLVAEPSQGIFHDFHHKLPFLPSADHYHRLYPNFFFFGKITKWALSFWQISKQDNVRATFQNKLFSFPSRFQLRTSGQIGCRPANFPPSFFI